MKASILLVAISLVLCCDASAQWKKVYSASEPLTDMIVLPTGRVIAVGKYEAFHISDDSGSSWRRSDLHSCQACYFDYQGLRMIDDTLFLWGRQYGQQEMSFAYSSMDGGDSWIREQDSVFVEHLDGDVISRTVAFDSLLTRHQGYSTYYLFRTLDGWKTQHIIDSTQGGQGQIMYRFDFKDSTTGLLARSFSAEPGAYLQRTKNAGRTWEWCEGRPSWTLHTQWLGGSDWLAADFNLRDAASVRRSTNDGATWQPVATNSPIPSGFYTDASSQNILAPALVDSWNQEFEGKYLVSSDRGLTWQLKRMMDSLRPVRKMAFVDKMVQLAIVDDTTILRTSNAGGSSESLAVRPEQSSALRCSTILLTRGELLRPVQHAGDLSIYNCLGSLVLYFHEVPVSIETSSFNLGLYFIHQGGKIGKLLIK